MREGGRGQDHWVSNFTKPDQSLVLYSMCFTKRLGPGHPLWYLYVTSLNAWVKNSMESHSLSLKQRLQQTRTKKKKKSVHAYVWTVKCEYVASQTAYVQSHICTHTDLCWCYSPAGGTLLDSGRSVICLCGLRTQYRLLGCQHLI